MIDSVVPTRYRKDHEGKRHRVVMHRGHEGYTVRWTQHCSGCTEYGDYCAPPEAGSGCHECGHTGKRRYSAWVPFDEDPEQLDWQQEQRELEEIRARTRDAGLDCVPQEWLKPWKEKWEKHYASLGES